MVYTFLDIETNGLDRSHDSPIQFAYLEMTEGGLFLRRNAFYINITSNRWSDEAQDVHGISREMLKKYGVEETRATASMYAVLASSVPTTYNGQSFDLPFIRNFCQRMGVYGLIPSEGFDVMLEWCKFHGVRRKKLTELVKELGYTEEYISALTKNIFGSSEIFRAHDARYDVVETMLVFKRLQQLKAERRQRELEAEAAKPVMPTNIEVQSLEV